MPQGQSRKFIRKSASDIRSAAAPRPGQLPHKTHMRLVCLETERYRRASERDSYLARAARCEERCAAIDAEVRQLMAMLVESRPRPLSEAETKPMARRMTRTTGQGRRDDAAPMLHSY